ncbi:unnamed protein product, partial [marine sediment metagenome]
HGFLHSFVGGSIVALLLAIVEWIVQVKSQNQKWFNVDDNVGHYKCGKIDVAEE